MKKAGLCAFLLICVFLSCKKSDSGSSGYLLTATVGGKSKNFNYSVPVATYTTLYDVDDLTITGLLDARTGEGMSIQLFGASGKRITAGTYVDTIANMG